MIYTLPFSFPSKKALASLLAPLLALLIFAPVKVESKKWEGPDYMIIGAQKSGTSALQFYLKQNPRVISKRKELHFFDVHFKEGVKWYKKQFNKKTHPRQVNGDKSPYYMFHPLVAKRVHSLYPKTKIIVLLRNPVDRAYSEYWHSVRHGFENLSFEKALKAEANRTSGEKERLISKPNYFSPNHRHFAYKARSLYAEQLKPWLKLFPRNQILIVSFDDFVKQSKSSMEKISAFLGIKNKWPLKPYKSRHAPYPPMDPETRKELVEFFRGPNRELEALTGMEFSWEK